MLKPAFEPDVTQFSLENAYFTALASELVYENKQTTRRKMKSWGFRRCRNQDGPRDTQCFIAQSPEAIVISFRGTEPNFDDWMTDAQLRLVAGPLGRCHEGFSLALAGIWPDLLDHIDDFQDQGQGIWLTGHSLGGALATLAAAKFCERGTPVRGLYTFGAPRVGDSDFADRLSLKMEGRLFRVVNNNDVVTRVPPRGIFGYRHPSGGLVYLDENGDLTLDPSAWSRFVDRIKGLAEKRFNGFLDTAPDAISDHSISAAYVPILARLVEEARG